MTEATTDIPALMRQIGDAAQAAARDLFTASTDAKNRALREAAASIRDKRADLKAANDLDMAGGEKKGLTAALLDRLKLDDDRIEGMARGLEDIAGLEDPVGTRIAEWDRPNGLQDRPCLGRRSA